MGFLPWDLCLSGGTLRHEGGRAALLPGADWGVTLAGDRLRGRGGFEVKFDGEAGERGGEEAELERRGGDFAGGEDGAD